MDDIPETLIRELHVISDTPHQDGVHNIVVLDKQKMTKNIYHLTYWVDDETIHIGGVTNKSLGFDDRVKISGVKIISIRTPDKQIIWPRRHTGFQTQKIW